MARLKERILQSAKILFQENGYENVSLRAIAEHAGTTIGNLTYHYPQKEDLLVAMQISTQGEAVTHFGKMPATGEGILREMVVMAYLIEQICVKRSFFFGNTVKLCQDMPSLKAHVEETRRIAFGLYLERLLALRDKGMMRADIPDHVYESLVASYLLGVASWMKVKTMFMDRGAQTSIYQVMVDLMFPFLTKDGIRELETIHQNEDAFLREAQERLEKIL